MFSISNHKFLNFVCARLCFMRIHILFIMSNGKILISSSDLTASSNLYHSIDSLKAKMKTKKNSYFHKKEMIWLWNIFYSATLLIHVLPLKKGRKERTERKSTATLSSFLCVHYWGQWHVRKNGSQNRKWFWKLAVCINFHVTNMVNELKGFSRYSSHQLIITALNTYNYNLHTSIAIAHRRSVK